MNMCVYVYIQKFISYILQYILYFNIFATIVFYTKLYYTNTVLYCAVLYKMPQATYIVLYYTNDLHINYVFLQIALQPLTRLYSMTI